MVDRTVGQEAILAEDTEFKIRKSSNTDYAIFDDVIDDTVTFTPEGNETKKFEPISGVVFEVPGRIRNFVADFPVWLTTNELELLKIVFGNSTQTGTAPYVYNFAMETLGQDCDFVITGTRYGSTTEKVTMTGTTATIKLTSLGIEKGGLWKMNCEITVSSANLDISVTSDTALT